MSTPGEEIKILRKKLNITQSALAKILNRDRTTISKIERGKQAINYKLAVELAEAFNAIAVNKNLNIGFVTAMQFTQPNKKTIADIENEYLKKLLSFKELNYSESIHNEIANIIDFFTNNDVSIQNKYSFYDLTIYIYFKAGKYIGCKFLILKALVLAAELKNHGYTLKLYSLLIIVYTYLKEFEQIILLEKNLGNLPKDDTTKIYLKAIYHNCARAYSEMGDYNTALDLLNKIEYNFQLTENETLDIENFKTYLELKKKNYKVAENQYLHMLSNNENLSEELTARIYIGLAMLYFETNSLNEANKYIEKAFKKEILLRLPGTVEQAYELKLYIACKSNQEFTEIKKAFENIVNNPNIIKYETMMVNVIKEMFKYCVNNRKYDYLIELLNIINNEIGQKNIDAKNVINIYIETCDVFRKIDSKKAKEMFEMCLTITRSNYN